MRGFYPLSRKPANKNKHQSIKINQPTRKTPVKSEEVPSVAIEQEEIEIIEIIPLKKKEIIKEEKIELKESKKEIAITVPLEEKSRFELMKMAKDLNIKVSPSDKKEDLITKLTKKEEK